MVIGLEKIIKVISKKVIDVPEFVHCCILY